MWKNTCVCWSRRHDKAMFGHREQTAFGSFTSTFRRRLAAGEATELSKTCFIIYSIFLSWSRVFLSNYVVGSNLDPNPSMIPSRYNRCGLQTWTRSLITTLVRQLNVKVDVFTTTIRRGSKSRTLGRLPSCTLGVMVLKSRLVFTLRPLVSLVFTWTQLTRSHMRTSGHPRPISCQNAPL